MENYKAELKKLSTITEQLKSINADIDRLVDKYSNLSLRDRVELKKSENEEYKKTEKELSEKSKVQNRLEIMSALQKQNIKVALYEDIKSIICEVWNSYAGKRYGEVTKKKVHDAILEKANCSFWVHDSYSMYFEICPLSDRGYSMNDYQISIANNNGEYNSLLDNNVIQAIQPENLRLWFAENSRRDISPAGIEAIENAYSAVVAAQDAMNEAIKNYMALSVEGLPRMHQVREARNNFLKV